MPSEKRPVNFTCHSGRIQGDLNCSKIEIHRAITGSLTDISLDRGKQLGIIDSSEPTVNRVAYLAGSSKIGP
jgi:hypothetical protein